MTDVESPTAPFDPAAEGWEPVASAAFGTLVGPIWQREEGERLRFGLVVAPKHTNRADNLHGGMLMTLADQALAFTARKETGKAHATMELHIHFVGVVRVGEFVEVRTEVVRATRSVVFLEAKMLVDDRVVATANGIWKIIGEP
jgi:uncharacterized protein (TIGR00369 family)